MESKRKIILSLKKISNTVKRTIDQKLDNNLTHNQMVILKYISEESKKRTVKQKDIEKLLEIRRSTVSEILHVMEREDLIKRSHEDNNKRSKIITLSEKGIIYIKQFEKTVSELEQQLLQGVSAEEKRNFVKTLEKIKNNLNNINC